MSDYKPPLAESPNADVNTNIDSTKLDSAVQFDKHNQSLSDEKTATTKPAGLGDGSQYLPMGFRLYSITAALMLGVFCVALDNNIIGVAIPRITDEFHSLNDVGWYGSAYLLPGCAFQLLFGKLYSIFSVKWVYLSGLLLFEVGTVICGAAPNSTALIIGRAIAGLGSSGLFIGATLTIAQTVPLAKRPAFMGTIGGVYGIASVIGPLLGGAFTDNVTWRWCFYINLPLGAVTAAGFLLTPRPADTPASATMSWGQIVKKLDPAGSVLFIGGIVSLLLALQWGGLVHPWSDGRVIALLVVFAVAIVAFAATQLFVGENATIPTQIARQRSVAFACLFGFTIGGSFFIITYYMPLWFQAIKNDNPIQAGVHFLPFILPEIFGIIIAGGLVTAFGYYNPFLITSSVLMSIAAGLCTTLSGESSQGQWVGYQFLYGIGVGIGFQQGPIVAQTVLPPSDIAVGTAMVLFVQIFGGALFVSVAQNVFASNLVRGLMALDVAGLDPHMVLTAGATNLRDVVSAEDLPRVLLKYNYAVVRTFQIGLIVSAISLIGALGVQWKSVKGEAPKSGPEDAAAELAEGKTESL
ncbi:major facilitator superfamily domain-containing protein [Xylariaceae sp. AK1471]|nr:major facilitator superfamily domain-containing protein [Xylariaceae sp. AK1471]